MEEALQIQNQKDINNYLIQQGKEEILGHYLKGFSLGIVKLTKQQKEWQMQIIEEIAYDTGFTAHELFTLIMVPFLTYDQIGVLFSSLEGKNVFDIIKHGHGKAYVEGIFKNARGKAETYKSRQAQIQRQQEEIKYLTQRLKDNNIPLEKRAEYDEKYKQRQHAELSKSIETLSLSKPIKENIVFGLNQYFNGKYKTFYVGDIITAGEQVIMGFKNIHTATYSKIENAVRMVTDIRIGGETYGWVRPQEEK